MKTVTAVVVFVIVLGLVGLAFAEHNWVYEKAKTIWGEGKKEYTVLWVERDRRPGNKIHTHLWLQGVGTTERHVLEFRGQGWDAREVIPGDRVKFLILEDGHEKNLWDLEEYLGVERIRE